MTRRLSLLVSAALLAVVLPASPPASGSGPWAPAGSAKLHPGVQMYTRGAQCTANFVYTDAAAHVYVGYAAHCAGLGEATDTNGCDTPSVPLGTTIRFAEGGSLVSKGTTVGYGTLVYSSWVTMHKRGVTFADACAYNDLALVRVGRAYVGEVNPSLPFWGGPTALDTDDTPAGERVYSYGNSSLRAGVTELAPRTGVSLGQSANGWSHDVYTLTPGIPGDSGSGFVDAEGHAIGTLSTIALAPLTGSNGLGDLRRELRFAQSFSGISGLRLVPGTEPFDPGL